MSNVRLIIVGLGLVGRRHAISIHHVDNVELAGIVDTSEEAKRYAQEHGLPVFDDIEKALDAISPDGVILSTPTPLHVQQASISVAWGIPVLVEKPLAVTADEAEALVKQAEEISVPLLVGHHRRYNPIIEKAWQLIQDGAIGDVRAVQAQCWFYKPDHYFEVAPWRTRKGAGPVSVNLVHDVDLMRYLCGEVSSVSAQMSPSSRGFENEEVAAAVLGFQNGAIGTITVSDGIVSPWSWELTSGEYPIYPVTSQSCYQLGGSNGSLSVPDLTLWNQHGQQDWWEPISGTSMPRTSSDPLINQIAHFKAVIREKIPPLVSGHEGLKTLRVLEAIEIAAKTKSTVDVV